MHYLLQPNDILHNFALSKGNNNLCEKVLPKDNIQDLKLVDCFI